MKKLIQVTEEDIKLGKERDAKSCPIAIALRRNFKHKRVNVASIITIGGFMDAKSMKATDEIIKFIRKFDDFQEVEPFEFYFEPMIQDNPKELNVQ